MTSQASPMIKRLDLDAVPKEYKESVEKLLLEANGLPFFSGPLDAMYSLEFAGNVSVCPRCGGRLAAHTARYIYATSQAPRLVLAPGGHFCEACPTGVVDVDIIRKAIRPGQQFLGILGLENERKECLLFSSWNDGNVIHVFNHDRSPQRLLTFDTPNLTTDSGKGIAKPRLSILPDPEIQVMRLPDGPYAGRPLQFLLEVCDNPFCNCHLIEVFIHPAPDRGEKPAAGLPEKAGGPLPYFRIDVWDRALDDEKAFQAHNPENVSLGKAFLAALSDNDWEQLQDYFAAHKQRQEEECLPNDDRVQFPLESLNDTNYLFPFVIHFPFSTSLKIDDDGECFDAIDTYSPQCKHATGQVVLQWFRRNDGISGEDPDRPVCLFEWDVRRNCLGNKPSGPLKDRAKRFLGLLKQQNPEAADLFLRRESLLISLFNAWKSRQTKEEKPASSVFLDNEPSDAAPGRNDPCPCGSGRKFKKCCG